MKPVVFAFAGRRGSGKSTASQALIDAGFKEIKFADPLKNMLRAFYATCGVDEETTERKIEGDLKEVPCEWLSGKTPRFAMQMLGTEWRDLFSKDLWSDILIKRVESGSVGDRVVCSDLRFPHEIEALEKLGARTIRIVRPDAPDDEYSKHASESQIDSLRVGMVVNNTGTIEDLREWVTELAEVTAALQRHGVIDDIIAKSTGYVS